MRPSTLFALTLASVTSAGCVAAVGGDECVGSRCEDDTDAGAGSDETKQLDCSDPIEITEPLTFSSDAEILAKKLPTKCWTLNANLRLEGTVTSLAKLGGLSEVNDLEIVGTALTTLDTVQTVKVYGSLMVSGNDRLTGLDHLNVRRWSGSTEGGAFSVSYVVRDNKVLANINGMKLIPQVDRELSITNNPKLTTLDFTELATIGGALTISGAGATSINISHLGSVAGLDISSNPALTTISGLSATTIFGSVKFATNGKLTTIGSMSSLAQITGNLLVDDNDALTNLGALTGTMQRITGSVTVTNNAGLTDLGLLSHLSQGIGSTVTISSNTALDTCKAVEVKHCGKAPSGVTIAGNANSTTNQNNCNCWCD